MRRQLSALLRPRLTIRYLTFSVVFWYVTLCFITGMPLLSSPLPPYTGPYGVGTIDLEAPCASRIVSDAILKETGKPAFEIETVLFTLYYPAIKAKVSNKHKHAWLERPASLHAHGYARFAHMDNFVMRKVFTWALKTIAGGIKIPAAVDVPIHGSMRGYGDLTRLEDDYGLPEFPVIVFSHGMASHRVGYTHYCAELASRGYIVAAVEHRDGSGPGTIVMRGDGSKSTRLHFGHNEIEPEAEISAFKTMQLAMREAEVEEVVRVLHLINDGFGTDVLEANPRGEGITLASWKGRLNMESVIIAGHSYGATLALQTLKGGPTKQRPFVGCIALDPGKQSGPLNDDIHVPLLVVHSNSWSAKFTIFEGSPHFEVVRNLANRVIDTHKKYAWFLTASGTTHPSVTDAPLVEPFLCSWTTGATINVHEGLMQYVKVTYNFLDFLQTGHRRGILKEEVTHPEYDHDVRDDNRRKSMDPEIAKYWQIHVAPSTACPAPGYCGVENE